MKKQRDVRLLKPVRRRADDSERKSKADTVSWEGVDKGLFEDLRVLRRDLADAKQVPPYIIFSDATLRELARVRPSSLEKLRLVYGIGDAKLREHGAVLLQRILDFCRVNGLTTDMAPRPVKPREAAKPAPLTGTRATAFELFRQQAAIEDVMHQTGRTHSTIMDYLADFVQQEKIDDISPWVPADIQTQVTSAATKVGTDRLKPIFIELAEKVPYDMIRLVVARMMK